MSGVHLLESSQLIFETPFARVSTAVRSPRSEASRSLCSWLSSIALSSGVSVLPTKLYGAFANAIQRIKFACGGQEEVDPALLRGNEITYSLCATSSFRTWYHCGHSFISDTIYCTIDKERGRVINRSRWILLHITPTGVFLWCWFSTTRGTALWRWCPTPFDDPQARKSLFLRNISRSGSCTIPKWIDAKQRVERRS